MFCTNCGEKLPDKSKFCPACGTKFFKAEDGLVSKENAATAAAPEIENKAEATKIADTIAATPEPEEKVEGVPINMTPAKQGSEETTGTSTLEDVIGGNVKYYLTEFEKVEHGEKTRFNWASFLLGMFFCFYRKCGEMFKKYFLVPAIILISALAIVSVGTASFSLTAMSIGGVASLVGSLWMFVSYIRFGKNFNKEYWTHCNTVLADGNRKKYGTSLGSAILALCVALVLGVAPSIIAVAGLGGGTGGLSNKGIGSSFLDGEYALVEDDSSGEYFYLNFNVNGPGTLQFSLSNDPSELMEASYKIVSTDEIFDGTDAYSLLVDNEYLGGNTEFFRFTPFDESTYYVCFSEEMMGEDGVTAMMVPFTEEWGFGQNIDANEEDYASIEDSTSDVGEDPYGVSGVYISTKNSSKRIVVTDTADMLLVEFMDNDKGIAVTDLHYGSDLDMANDILFFDSYAIGLEEEIHGSFTPYLETLEISLPEDSILFAYGFEGLYLKEELYTSQEEAQNTEVNKGSSSILTQTQGKFEVEQEALYSSMLEQIKGLNDYESQITGNFLDDYYGIYIEVFGFCDDDGSDIYFLNYWADVQLEAIPFLYLEEDGDYTTLMFSLDDYFSDHGGYVSITSYKGMEYSLCSEIENCQDTGGYYDDLEYIDH